MPNKKNLKRTNPKSQNAIITKQVQQLHIDLKRGLLPYIILFFLKIRPHYSLEIYKKIAYINEKQVTIRQNIVYQNLKKFEQKGIVASYLEKSTVGAKRKYYYLTKLGEQVFDEIVMTRLYPLMFMFSTIMENMTANLGIKHKVSKKELNKIQNHICDVIDK